MGSGYGLVVGERSTALGGQPSVVGLAQDPQQNAGRSRAQRPPPYDPIDNIQQKQAIGIRWKALTSRR